MKATRLNVGPIVPFKKAATAADKAQASQHEVARKLGAKAADAFVTQQEEGQTFLAQTLRECIGKSVSFLSGFREQAAKRYDDKVVKLKLARTGPVGAANHAGIKGSMQSIYNRKSEVDASIKACLFLGKSGGDTLANAKRLADKQGYHSLVGFFRGINAQATYGTVNVVKIAEVREKAAKLKLAKAGELGARKDSVKRNILFASVKELEQLAALIQKRLVIARKNEAAHKAAGPKA